MYIYIILGLLCGILIMYIMMPARIIDKYPTMDNINKNIYVDKNGTCYKYHAKEIQC